MREFAYPGRETMIQLHIQALAVEEAKEWVAYEHQLRHTITLRDAFIGHDTDALCSVNAMIRLTLLCHMQWTDHCDF